MRGTGLAIAALSLGFAGPAFAQEGEGEAEGPHHLSLVVAATVFLDAAKPV